MLSPINSDAVFIFSKGNGIYVLKSKEIQKLPETENYEINDVSLAGENNLLIGTTEGLFLEDLKTQRLVKLKGFDFQINKIQRLIRGQQNYLVSTIGQGIFQLELNYNSLKIIKQFTDTLFSETSVFQLDEYKNDLYVSNKNQQLMVLNLETTEMKIFDAEQFQSHASCIFIDKTQNVWLGSAGDGLYRICKTEFEIIDLKNETVFAIAQDKNENTYLGTKSGLRCIKPGAFVSQSITSIGGILLGKINALYVDDKNKLWVGTQEHGLIVCDPTTFKKMEVEFSAIPNISVNAITGNTKDEEILVSTNLSGVYSYAQYKIRRHFSVENGLLHNNVYSSQKTKDGRVYYATHNTAFNFSKNDQIYVIDSKDKGLTSDFNCFSEDRFGNLVIGTNGSGIYELQADSIKIFKLNQELESKFCKALLYDHQQALWIIGGKDLYVYYKKENFLKKITFQEALHRTPEFRALYMNNKGDVFAVADKFILLQKNKSGKSESTAPAKPYLINVSVDDSLVDLHKQLDLKNGKYKIKIEFSALGLKNSEQFAFKYKLEGRDGQWSEASKTKVVEFSNVSEGDYTFKVRVINDKGFEEKEELTFHFLIMEPFWKLPLFWIFSFLFLVAIIAMIIRVRTATLINAKIKLENIIEEKTRELREEKRIVEESNKTIEDQNHEIKDSILYAKRIQDALLPDKKIIADRSDRIFVFYQPRDIVSGDFYWLGEVNNIKIVVVADCTGHGVPGAFMSMIGNTLLNKIIIERKITEAGEILQELDKEVRRSLKQYSEESTKDGMDVALCCIDERKKRVTYCGALRPLMHVRQNNLTHYQPNKHSIGGYNYGVDRQFKQETIEVQEGDMLYIFSDGFADQFGGEKGKKFMLKDFKKLLTDVSQKEVSQQENILNKSYNGWKGEYDQVDDVLVIGMKM